MVTDTAAAPKTQGSEADKGKGKDKEKEKTSKKVKRAIKGADIKTTTIPPIIDPKYREVETYAVEEPYSFVRIVQYIPTGEYTYCAIEPILDDREKEILAFLFTAIVDTVDFSRQETDDRFLSDEDVKLKMKFIDEAETTNQGVKAFNRQRLKVIMNRILRDMGKELDPVTREKIFYYLYTKFMGYDKIHIMMMDPELEDVSCDGVNTPIFVFHRRFKNIKTNVIYDSHEYLDSFVVSMAQMSGKSISISRPVLDATLPDGSRLNQTLGTEVTTRGSSFTIRKFKEDPLTITDLVRWRTVNPDMAAHLWLAVQYGESMICSGGTASGKTTTLNAVSHFIPPSAKIITIEDTREMQLPHENWIAALTREKKGGDEAVGQNIDMYALLVAALRQRPEYMVVGEVRGKETMTVFQAMATGQTTYSTIHADSVASIVHRLENPPINIPRILILGLNLIILQAQVTVKNKRTRRIKELAEIIGLEPTSNEIITNSVYKWNPGKDLFKYTGHSKLYEKIMDRENMTSDEVLAEVKARRDIIVWMAWKHLRNHSEVSALVNEYYREPKAVLTRVREELQHMDRDEVEEWIH